MKKIQNLKPGSMTNNFGILSLVIILKTKLWQALSSIDKMFGPSLI